MECSHLPSNMFFEILLRASNDTLRRCIVASKEWNYIIYNSKFIILHSQKQHIVHGFFVTHLNTNKHDCSFASIIDHTTQISLDFLPGSSISLKAVSANHGIILCALHNPMQYWVPRFFVSKPRVKLLQQISKPRTKFWTEGLELSVVRSNPFRYKILRISSSKEKFMKSHRRLICEVFDLESWTWKRLKNIMLPCHVLFMGRHPAVTVCGSFHWLISPNLVFAFDVQKEEWQTSKLPIKEDDNHIKLVKYEGQLALICMDSEGYMHTWILENYKRQEWKKKFCINMKDIYRNDLICVPMVFYGSDIIVLTKCWSLMFYDFKNGRVLKETKLKKINFSNSLFPFWSDSEQCCLRGSSN